MIPRLKLLEIAGGETQLLADFAIRTVRLKLLEIAGGETAVVYRLGKLSVPDCSRERDAFDGSRSTVLLAKIGCEARILTGCERASRRSRWHLRARGTKCGKFHPLRCQRTKLGSTEGGGNAGIST